MNELHRKIDNLRNKGLSDDEIRQHLLDEGWGARQINSALSNLSHKEGELWPGVFKTISLAYKRILSDPLPAIFYIGLFSLSALIISIFVKHYPYKLNRQNFISVVIGIETFLLYPYLIKYQLSLAKKSKLSIKTLLSSGLKTYCQVFLALLMVILLVAVGALLILIPLIWILPWSYMTFYVVIDQKTWPAESLKTARSLLHNNLSKAWAIIGVSLVLAIIVSIFSDVTVLYTALASLVGLVYETSMAILYVWLKKNNSFNQD